MQVRVETAFQLAFAAAVVVAGACLAATLARRIRRVWLIAAAVIVSGGAAAGWLVFAFRPELEIALAAAGLSACVVGLLAAIALDRALARRSMIDEELERAEGRLAALVAREARERATELERTLARARADSASLLAEEERRIADERRRLIADRERAAAADLSEALAAAERRAEHRLAAWRNDLDRTYATLSAHVTALRERHQQLLSEAEARIGADDQRLRALSDEQRSETARLREEFERAARDVVSGAAAELEANAAERRRALLDVANRLRQRERELLERIDREEGEARQRIQASFSDLGRRQAEQLERSLERAATRYSEAAAQQFQEAIRTAREDAARRLSRELERAVAAFARQADAVLAERLAQVADAGAQRVERRFDDMVAELGRRREESLEELERRVTETEADVRRRLENLSADAEAERGILEARLRDLARQLDDPASRARVPDPLERR